MKVLIYGAGATGRQVYNNIKSEYEVVGFLDGNPEKKGHVIIDGMLCLGGVEQLEAIFFEKIFIGSLYFYKDIMKLLLDSGVDEEKIMVDLPPERDTTIKDGWLQYYAKFYAGRAFSVAEGGVYQGDFAKIINKCFPNSKLYLFDTFEGFDKRDVKYEKDKYDEFGLNEGFLSETSVDLVMSKMSFPSNIEIRQGYFPSTAYGIDDVFCFVHLDFDLYLPILEGLRFFYPKMLQGSVLLIDDYYHFEFPGVKDAIEDYEKEISVQLIKIPIGDDRSIAIVKN